jgi:integrase
MATVGIQPKKLKSGKRSYSLWYKDPSTGKQYHYKTYRWKKVADEESIKLRILIDTGSLPEPSSRRKKGAVTFDEVGNLLRTEWENRAKTQELARSTADGYLVQLKMLGKVFNGRMLGSITKDEVLQFRSDVAGALSNVTSNRRLFVLKQVFAKAKEKKFILKDEISGIRYLSEKAHERTNWLKPDQLDKLLDVASKARSRHYMVLAILLTAEHGASKQEILDLRWDDIDFDLGDSGYIGFYRTKNEVQRMHPLQMERTRDALLARRKYLAKYRKIAVEEVDGYVVGHPDGRPMLDFCTTWRTIRKNAGMPEFHFHDLRHTFCTNLIFSGRTLPQTQKLIGHKTAKMTERYSHFEIMEGFTGFRDLSQRYKTGA